MMAKLRVAGADLEDHDPNNLSSHLKVSWDEVIGEPEGIRSPECAWRVSNWCFAISRNCCYIFLSVIVAPISALCLGCAFACLAFEHIWCVTPCMRVWSITCNATRKCTFLCANGLISPICQSFGLCLNSIKIRTQILTEDNNTQKDDIFLV